MKKLFFFALLLLISAPHALADGFTPLAAIPGLTNPEQATSVINSQSLAAFFNNLYLYLIGLAAVAAIIMIIWGGFEYATQDSISAKGAGKARIQEALLGLVLVLSPFLVFSIINPSILNLSLNLPKLNQLSPAAGGGASGGTAGGAVAGQQWCYLRTDSASGPQCSATQQACEAARAVDNGLYTVSACGQQQAPAQTTAGAGGCSGCTVTGTLLKTATCPDSQTAQSCAADCKSGTGSVSSSNTAICDTTQGSITGPYAFADTSTATGIIGWINTITQYSYYQPIANMGGTAAQQFATTCATDGGTTCMGNTKLPCSISNVSLGSTSGGHNPVSVACWSIFLSCTAEETGSGGCSKNPNFTPVQTN